MSERTFKSLIVMYLSRWPSGILALQHSQEALVDANILLLRLDHPNPLLPHRPDDPKDVDVFRYQYLLQYSVESDEGTTATHTGAAMDDYGPLIRPDSFPERSHEPGQSLGWTGYAEVWPSGEVEVLYHSLYVAL